MKTQDESTAAALPPVVARPHLDQKAAQAQPEQRTGEVVMIEVGGKMVECRLERVLDLEAPQVMMSVLRVIATQVLVLRVFTASGAATVEIGASETKEHQQAFRSVIKKMVTEAISMTSVKEATTKKPARRKKKTRSRSMDRPARQRQLKSR